MRTSAQPSSRMSSWELADIALSFTMSGTAPGAIFTAMGLSALDNLLTLGSLLLFVGLGVVTVVLIVISLSLRRAASMLPPASLSSKATTQQKRESRRVSWVLGSIVAAILLQSLLLSYFRHGGFIVPSTGFLVGIGFLLTAFLGHVQFYYPLGLAHTLLGSVALLALVFGVTFGSVFTWTVIEGLGYILIFWVTILYLLTAGRRLLSRREASHS